jgi:hypothetical protein
MLILRLNQPYVPSKSVKLQIGEGGKVITRKGGNPAVLDHDPPPPRVVKLNYLPLKNGFYSFVLKFDQEVCCMDENVDLKVWIGDQENGKNHVAKVLPIEASRYLEFR